MKLLKTICIISLVSACSEENRSSKLDSINWAESNATYLSGNDISETAVRQRANDMNSFGSRLLDQMQKKSPDANQLISSLSIQSAFGLLYPATNALDATEISDTLGFGAKDDFYGSMRGLNSHYRQLAAGSKKLKLNVYNNVWSQEDLTLQEAYLKTIKEQFDGKVGLLDFVKKPEEARLTINDFIAKNTNQLIKDLLPQGFINDGTTTVLTNAVYLKAPFVNQFDKPQTSPKVFHRPDGDISVPFMHNAGIYPNNLSNDQHDYDVVTLPLEGDVAMMFVKTRTNDWRNLQKLAADQAFWQDGWQNLLSGLQNDNVKVSIPKFKMNVKSSIKGDLKNLGLSTVFEESKDNFSLLYQETIPLMISDIIHATVLEVDETGVEAAAATAIGVGTTSAPAEPELTFEADEPCMIVIYDKKFGSVMFLGLLIDPA